MSRHWPELVCSSGYVATYCAALWQMETPVARAREEQVSLTTYTSRYNVLLRVA